MTDLRVSPPSARLRLGAVLAIVLATIWSIAPGKTQPDTKLNLTEDPWSYLYRALFAWNDHAGLGELQNQAYGYLFPMGPIFGLGDILGMPDWAVQRLWWSLIIVVGFVGTHRFTQRIGRLSSDWAIVCALIYVFSPRLLSVLANISIEVWPAAVAPWLLLAAASMAKRGATSAQLLRGSAATALLVSACGGVNATASLAVLLLPFLWIATASHATMRLRVIMWWLLGAVLGASWWLVPLLVLGRYGYPFLDYIETSRITTAVTSLPNSLRGASHWIPYILDAEGHPVWQGGWVQAQFVTAIISGTIVAAVAIGGLLVLRTRREHRHLVRFLAVSLLIGLLAVSLGYGGPAFSPISAVVRDFLDGPGAPLRNVHKFDPLIRLPIAFGFTYALVFLARSSSRWAKPVFVGGCVAALLSPTALWVGRVTDAHAVEGIPDYWRTVARSVDELAQHDGGSTLVLPHARTADMSWGTVSDEPLSVLASSKVTIRAAAPLGHPGGTRLLDAIDTLVGQGQPSAALATVLQRMGIKRIVVRDDVRESVTMHDAAQVRESLSNSPGFELVDDVEGVTLWNLTGESGAELYPARSAITIDGVPEDLVTLLDGDQGRLTASAAVIEPGTASPDIVTDSFRWVLWNSGFLPAWGTSELLERSDSGPTRIGSRPLPPVADAADMVAREWRGVSSVSASSSAADPFGALRLGSAFAVASALDGNDATQWWSDLERESIFRLDFDDQTNLGELTIRLAAPANYRLPKSLELDLYRGQDKFTSLQTPVPEDGVVAVNMSPFELNQLRIRFPKSSADTVRAITDVSSSTISWGSVVSLPRPIDFSNSQLVLNAERTGSGSIAVGRSWVTRATEAPRAQRWNVDVANAQDLEVLLRARSYSTPELEEHLDRGHFQSDQRVAGDIAHRPGASFDGDPSTAWQIPAGIDHATVSIAWNQKQHITGLDASNAKHTVRLVHEARVALIEPGITKLDLTTDALELSFTRPSDIAADQAWTVPEVEILGAPDARNTIETACDVASVSLGESHTNFRLSLSVEQLAQGESLTLEPCTPAPMSAEDGEVDVQVETVPWLRWESLSIRGTQPAVAEEVSPSRPIKISQQNATLASLDIAATEDSILALPHGFNAGWVAEDSAGQTFEPLTVDGWKQGFVIPAGTDGKVTLRFAPQQAHLAGLALGPLVALIAVMCLLLTRKSEVTFVEAQSDAAELDSADQSWKFIPMLSVVAVGGLFSGWQGLVLGVLVCLIPRRLLMLIGSGAMVCAGIALAAFGVVDHASIGAHLGQLLALSAILVLVRWWFVGARNEGSAVPADTTRP